MKKQFKKTLSGELELKLLEMELPLRENFFAELKDYTLLLKQGKCLEGFKRGMIEYYMVSESELEESRKYMHGLINHGVMTHERYFRNYAQVKNE